MSLMDRQRRVDRDAEGYVKRRFVEDDDLDGGEKPVQFLEPVGVIDGLPESICGRTVMKTKDFRRLHLVQIWHVVARIW